MNAVTTTLLPAPSYPVVTRVISNALFPEPASAATVACPHCRGAVSVPSPSLAREEPTTWVLGHPHPLVPEMKIVRMFLVYDVGVEVYAVNEKAGNGTRTVLPMPGVRFVEEAMPLDLFVDELTMAEERNLADDPDEPGDSPLHDPAPPGEREPFGEAPAFANP